MRNGANTAGLKAPWQKGQSGNPNGRPKKVQTVAQLAEDNSEKALKKLIKLIDSDKDQVALAAAQAVLDRAMGKPKQSMDVNANRKNAADYDESELYAIAGLGRSRDHSPPESADEPDRLQ
jgi:lipopolysaccharide biosynthesis regulator YciM